MDTRILELSDDLPEAVFIQPAAAALEAYLATRTTENADKAYAELSRLRRWVVAERDRLDSIWVMAMGAENSVLTAERDRLTEKIRQLQGVNP